MNPRNLRALAHSALLCLLVTGCGVGGVAAASAGGGGGGGGSGAKPPPPTSTVTAPPGTSSDYVTFVYEVRDPQVKDTSEPPLPGQPQPQVTTPRVQVTPQFARLPAPPGEEVWVDMTEAALQRSEGTRGLPVGTRERPEIGQHTFVWDTIVDLPSYAGRVKVRVLASYEATEDVSRRFRVRDSVFTVDNRRAVSIAGTEDQGPGDVDTFPVDVRPQGDAFVVADLGANIVERVAGTGRIERLLGYGVPGDTLLLAPNGQSPGVVRLPTLVAFDVDPAGNLFTNHSSSLVVTNRGPTAFSVLGKSVPARTTVRVTATNAYVLARGARFHPSGALVLANNPGANLAEIVIVNRDANPAVTLAGVTIAPGTQAVIAGGAAAGTTAEGAPASATQINDAVGVAVGPDGEIYYVERALGRVRVINTKATSIVVGGVTVAAGAVQTVAGGNGLGFSGDDDVATSAQLNLPNGLDVSSDRTLFIADTSNLVIRAVNLGLATKTFAQSTIEVGDITTVVGVHDGSGGGVGSRALEIQLGTPNSVTVDALGNLLVSDQHQVLLVNGGIASVTSYGKTAGPTRTALVYDATSRGGLPLRGPRAVHAAAPEIVYFTDRTSVRVLNLAREPKVYGGAAADAGGTAVVAGGAVPGYSGDGGAARSAAFANPAALMTDGAARLYVADTENDRVRLVNVADPRLPLPAQVAFGVSVASGAVATVAGGATGPLVQFGDGLAPTSASLSMPQGLALSSDGLLFVADTGHHRIRVMNPGPAAVTLAGVTVAPGTIGTLLGGNLPGFTPDGPGPWLLDTPTALAFDGALLYFAEIGNARIRVLNLSAATVTCAGLDVLPSTVRTIVGSGVRGNAGDGGLGPDAQIDAVHGLFVQTINGTRAALYFTDGAQNVVRALNLTADTDLVGAIDFQGRPTVTIPARSVISLAGGPNILGFMNPPSFAGDGDEAAAMRFDDPWGIAIAVSPSTGRPVHLFIADEGNNRLRRVGAPPLVQ